MDAARRPDPSAARLPFEWLGGALCLDFVNTASWRPEGIANERFRSAADVWSWGQEAHLVPPSVAPRGGGARWRQLLTRALELRARLHELFAARACNGMLSDDGVERLGDDLESFGRRLSVVAGGAVCEWVGWKAGSEPQELLRPVVWSAAELLVSPALERLGICADPACGWLFVDRSRRGNRRWCSMAECGSRAKARRHYRRKRR